MYVSVQRYIPGPGSRLNNFPELFAILRACLVMAASCRKCDCSMTCHKGHCVSQPQNASGTKDY